MITCYTTVSDLALCQRCPALLTYKTHYGAKFAWSVGIKGGGSPYGSMFHENIARVFFEAAAHPQSVLHAGIVRGVCGGRFALEEFVRTRIFLPYVSRYSESLTSGQITAMARGVSVWVRAMSEFFRDIPSLRRDPEGNMHTVFIEPEQKLQGCYKFDGGRLMITGCYDALMFNPDRAEARLFEFKGYRKSDITVPLSQSLIYSWLIWKRSGILPSVEIIYLDEENKAPDVFDSQSVKEMIKSGLPELFKSAFDVISLRRRPEFLRNRNLCSECHFSAACSKDYDNVFRRKRQASSMISVLVFFMMAIMITAQVYFFTTLSLEGSIDEREIMGTRIRLEHLIDEGKNVLSSSIPAAPATYSNFYDGTRLSGYPKIIGNDYVSIHTLSYDFVEGDLNVPMHERIFSSMPPIRNDSGDILQSFYLIRAYTKTSSGRNLMHQVLVRIDRGSKPETLTYQEVWY